MSTKHGLVRTIDDIKLVGNALTFILYKSYFGKDLLNDIIAFARKFSGGNLNIEAITEQDILDNIGEFEFDSEFLLQFIAALLATAQYPIKPDVTELILQIPPHWVADKDIIADLMDFLSLFISTKKVAAASSGGGL